MKKSFTFEFDEERPETLSYELSWNENERLMSSVEDGIPTLYMNRPAMLTLAKILIKMAQGPYTEQFHVHIRKDFGDGPEALNVMLFPDDTEK
jgi:hypothetical protein